MKKNITKRENKIMIGIIFYKNQKNGKQQLQKIIKDYEDLNIKTVKAITFNDYNKVKFENGDFWKAVPFSSNSRGQRCNIAYVEWNITKEEIYTVIEPMLTLKPYNAIHIFY